MWVWEMLRGREPGEGSELEDESLLVSVCEESDRGDRGRGGGVLWVVWQCKVQMEYTVGRVIGRIYLSSLVTWLKVRAEPLERRFERNVLGSKPPHIRPSSVTLVSRSLAYSLSASLAKEWFLGTS